MSLRDNDHFYQTVYRDSAALNRSRSWPFGGIGSNDIVGSFVRFQHSSWPFTYSFPILPPTDPFHSCPKLSDSLLLWMARKLPPGLQFIFCIYAILVETSFKENCSGSHWVTQVFAYSAVIALFQQKKKSTCYHVFAADIGFCGKNPPHQRMKGYIDATHTRCFQDYTLQPTMSPPSTWLRPRY